MIPRIGSLAPVTSLVATVVVALLSLWFVTSRGAAAGAARDAAPDTALDDGTVAVGGAVAAGVDDDDAAGVDEALARAIAASQEIAHGGSLSVVSFSEDGPRISVLRVTQAAGALHVRRDSTNGESWELGRVDGSAFLRSSDALLRLGDVERAPAHLDRLRDNYLARLGGVVTIDTGPADVLHLADRDSGMLRETLYLDGETGLIVRRETYSTHGEPVRLVAYTELDVAPEAVEPLATDRSDVREHAQRALDPAEVSIGGGTPPPQVLPGGYELLALASLDASTPAVHLLYGDGLYSLSIFMQEGRLAQTAVRGAVELRTPEGGSVWRWPGSEPRRVVWTGQGRTFTVLSDAPTDAVLEAIAGLPADPPPSILDRLQRGMDRVMDWLTPGDGSET